MLEIKTIKTGQMQTNTYLIVNPKTRNSILVDPGDDGDYLMSTIKKEEINVNMIVATHGHFDHIMAVNELKFTLDIPFYANSKDKFLIKKMRENSLHFLQFDPGPAPEIDGFLKQDDNIKLDDENIFVEEAPGHTPGSICFYMKNSNALITGDLIFEGGLFGRIDFSYSDRKTLFTSIKKILLYSNETLIFPGHGISSTIQKERKFYNLL